jgi:DNA processing protein
MDNLLYWIWLSLSCTPGKDTFAKLIEKFNNPLNIYNASDSEIAAVITSDCQDYSMLCNKDTEKAKSILNFCTSKKVGILTYSDEKFPKSLREISNPPVLLYYRGVLPNFDAHCLISVVGTRALSSYGKTNTFKISHDLALAGAVIVSGMAKGIDGVALAGALSVGKSTVAVLGSGIDVCYPAAHKTLAREIVKNGCVFTEYCPGTPPNSQNFPVRNRLISGLSCATIVMEGDERSGAVITARCAQKQGRKVFAFPGNVGNTNSQATNLLIKNGASLITSADDVIRCFDKTIPARLNPFKLEVHPQYRINETLDALEVVCATSAEDLERYAKVKEKKTNKDNIKGGKQNENPPVSISAEESVMRFDKKTLSIYKKIPTDGDCSVDSLTDDNISLPDVMLALLNLEIARFIVMLPGDRVKRNLK